MLPRACRRRSGLGQQLAAVGPALRCLDVPALILLCAYGGLRSRRRPTRRLGWFMVYVTVFAGVMDLIEDHLLWRAFYRPPPSSTLLHVLFATSLAKWVVVLPMLYGLLSLTTAISRLARHDRTPPGGPVPSGLLPGPPAFLDPRHVAAPTPEAVKHRYKRPDATPADATGICLSGGGIRAAAFAMGALQSLESAGVYGQATYLATVSVAATWGRRPTWRARGPSRPHRSRSSPSRQRRRTFVNTPASCGPPPSRIATEPGSSPRRRPPFSRSCSTWSWPPSAYAIATPVGWAGHALFGERGTRPEGWLLATILVTIALGPLVTMAWARTLGRWIPGFRRWVAAAIAGAVTTAAAVQLLWFDVPYWWFWYALGALTRSFPPSASWCRRSRRSATRPAGRRASRCCSSFPPPSWGSSPSSCGSGGSASRSCPAGTAPRPRCSCGGRSA